MAPELPNWAAGVHAKNFFVFPVQTTPDELIFTQISFFFGGYTAADGISTVIRRNFWSYFYDTGQWVERQFKSPVPPPRMFSACDRWHGTQRLLDRAISVVIIGRNTPNLPLCLSQTYCVASVGNCPVALRMTLCGA
jgi:hypothetical protein